jgi:RNA polymerase sigma-70 factor, ECF subfamily
MTVVIEVPDERSVANPEHTFAAGILRAELIRALDILSPRERIIFGLKHYHGMQLKTVARILQTTEGTAKNTWFRATVKLRSRLAELR